MRRPGVPTRSSAPAFVQQARQQNNFPFEGFAFAKAPDRTIHTIPNLKENSAKLYCLGTRIYDTPLSQALPGALTPKDFKFENPAISFSPPLCLGNEKQNQRSNWRKPQAQTEQAKFMTRKQHKPPAKEKEWFDQPHPKAHRRGSLPAGLFAVELCHGCPQGYCSTLDTAGILWTLGLTHQARRRD